MKISSDMICRYNTLATKSSHTWLKISDGSCQNIRGENGGGWLTVMEKLVSAQEGIAVTCDCLPGESCLQQNEIMVNGKTVKQNY